MTNSSNRKEAVPRRSVWGFVFFNQYEVELQTRSSGSMLTKEGRDHGETGKVHLRAALSGGDALQSEDHGAAIGLHAAISPDFR